jgi:hypothetical protein
VAFGATADVDAGEPFDLFRQCFFGRCGRRLNLQRDPDGFECRFFRVPFTE